MNIVWMSDSSVKTNYAFTYTLLMLLTRLSFAFSISGSTGPMGQMFVCSKCFAVRCKDVNGLDYRMNEVTESNPIS